LKLGLGLVVVFVANMGTAVHTASQVAICIALFLFERVTTNTISPSEWQWL